MILREILMISITSLVEIKIFNALIDNKIIFDQPVKNKQEVYQVIFCSTDTIINSLAQIYHDKQIQLLQLISQETQQLFFYCWKAAKNYSKLFFGFIKHNRIMQTAEHQKILNLLNGKNDSRYAAKK